MRMLWILWVASFCLLSCTTIERTSGNTAKDGASVVEVAEDSMQTLAGYHYLEVVEQAAPTADSIPLLIALHWMGASPTDFQPFASAFGVPVRILLVQAPYPFEEGYSFFPLQPQDYYELPTAEKRAVFLAEARKLSRFVAAATKRYPSADRAVIMGASQGGDLSYAMAILYPEWVRLACPLLATIDESIIPSAGPSANECRIVAFHGSADPIVPIDTARHHIQYLQERAFAAELRSYPDVSHALPDQMQKDYKQLISQILVQ